jgi:hypothetical protein
MNDHGKHHDNPGNGRDLRGPAFAFLACGVTFLVLGSRGQSAMTGVGIPLLVLGIVFLARSRKPTGRKSRDLVQ